MIGCLATIPVALLPIFMAETAPVPHLREYICAQVWVESAWKPEARSRFAAGLAQFTPPTWAQYSVEVKPSCEGRPETDPVCSLRAMRTYLLRLLYAYRFVPSSDERLNLAWAAYNMGPGNMRKERRACARRDSCDDDRWTKNVERMCSRAGWACAESSVYPAKIRRRLAHARP